MDMSAASRLLARRTVFQADRGARIADLPVTLAVLSVQQAAGFTATRMREEKRPEYAGDEPARMAVIFASQAVRPGIPLGMAGAFNALVAERLSLGVDGENGVYSGV